jgi:D-serine deaminase-like pyridoxal phosphate-dependent protein
MDSAFPELGFPAEIRAEVLVEIGVTGGHSGYRAHKQVRSLMDHHNMLNMYGMREPHVNGWIVLGINPPCTTVTRWPPITLASENYVIHGAIQALS